MVAVPRCQTDHLADVLAGNYGWSVQSTGMGGPTADQKFYDPERVRNIVNSMTKWTLRLLCLQVKNYTGSIRFKDPERTVPVLA